MMPARAAWSPLWLPGLALSLGAALVLLGEPAPDRIANAGLAAIGVLLTWGAAVAVQVRYPGRPLAKLLFTLSVMQALNPVLTASSTPLLFTLGRAMRVVAECMLIWVMLAVPTGRLPARIDRWLVGAAVCAALLFWLPANLFVRQPPISGPFVLCAADCPRNLLFLVDRPDIARFLTGAFRNVGLLILAVTALRIAWRLLHASPLMRRALAPVQVVSMLRLLGLMVYLGTGTYHWVPILMYWAVPVAVAYGLLRGRLWIARSLQQLVTGLRATPSRHELQELIARALGDPSLQIGYWAAESANWLDADGNVLRLPMAGEGTRAHHMVKGESGEAAAVLIHDAALLEEPALVDAVASSMRMALAGRQLDATLRATRHDAALAAASERQRIERDLHDGAQQRLIALRMKVGVAQRLLDADPGRAAQLLDEVGPDIDAALKELRDLAHGIAPAMLVEQGLAPALADLAQRAGCMVRTEIEAIGRVDAATEHAVYFCCAEALQNATKHAGPAAQVFLCLRRSADRVIFVVGDDGPGLATAAAAHGHGLRNMRKRLAELGGRLDIRSRPGGGVDVQGETALHAR